MITNEDALKEVKHQVWMNTDNCEMTISKGCYKTIIKALEKIRKIPMA